MSAKKNYSRYFIILQEDEKGFSVDANKFPTGYSKIENKNNKCKISYYVQNLNKSKEPYYMILICSTKNENNLIKLGKMNIDDYGRAEISYEYDTNNIANSGISMDKIKGAAVVHFQETSMRPALTGFISGTRLEEWKKYSIIESKEQLREDKNEVNEQIDKSNEKMNKNSSFNDNGDIVKDKEVKERIETKKEKIDDDNKNKSENNMFDEYEKNIESYKNIISDIRSNDVQGNEAVNENIYENESDNITDELNDVDNTSSENSSNQSEFTEEPDDISESGDYRVEDIRNKDKEKYKEKCECKNKDKYKDKSECKCKDKYKDKEKYECKCKDKYKEDNKDYPVGVLGEFFKSLAKDLEEVNDVCPEIGKCKWYKVPVEKLENINETSDFNKYTVLYYPMICYYPYIKKYGHYLVGYKCDSKDRMGYLVYAIPGTKIMNDQPFGGATGFTTWVCKDHTDDKMYSVGYWVMFYDFKNSRIMMPVI